MLSFCVLDAVRLMLANQVDILSLNITVGVLGLVLLVYLLLIRGRWLPSPGYYLVKLRRVHRAEVQNYAQSGAQVLWCPSGAPRSSFRWIVLALSGLCVVAWVFVRVGASYEG